MKRKTGDLLATRQATHGDYPAQAEIAQIIKGAVMTSPNRANGRLTDQHVEALDMIASKIARICTGDPEFADHWDDIAGYAALGGGRWKAPR